MNTEQTTNNALTEIKPVLADVLSKDRIEQIKTEYASKWSYANWNSFLVHCKMNDWQLLDYHLNKVIDLIQSEIASKNIS